MQNPSTNSDPVFVTNFLKSTVCAAVLLALDLFGQHSAVFGQIEMTPARQRMVASNGKAVRKEEEFLLRAHVIGQYEVELGQLAQSRSARPKLLEYARTVSGDHERIGQELQALATARNVSLDQVYPKAAQKLEGKAGVDFDRAYLRQVVEDHENVVGLFEEAAKEGESEDVRTFATRHLDTLRAHLTKARQLKNEID